MGPKEWDAAAEGHARLREPLTLPCGLDTAGGSEWGPPDGLRADLEAVGFRGVAIQPLAHGWEVPSVGWLAEHADLDKHFYDRLGTGSRDRVLDALHAQLRAEYGDGPFALSAHAHLAVATK